MFEPQQTIKKARINVILVLIGVTIAINSVIIFSADPELKNYFGNIFRPVTASAATWLALVVVYRQKACGVFGRSYAALGAGLVMYLIAELIWGYYSVVLGIEVPFPSPADAFWLAAYVPFGYGLFTLSRLYSRQNKRMITLVVSMAVAVFSVFYIQGLLSVADLADPEAITPLAISIAYPILDGILIIPAVVAVLSAGKGYLTSIPWIFISWIFTALADSLFGYAAVTNIAGDFSIWNLFYNAAYLTMAAGLFWHNKYMIFDEKTIKARL